MKIDCVTDPSFAQYGRVLDFPQEFWSSLEVPMPQAGIDYEASYALLEDVPQLQAWLSREVFGTLPIQIGYISGHNQVLAGVGWHQGNEVHLAVTHLCLLVAKRRDLKGKQLENIRAYYIPAYSAIELFADTFHLTPVSCDEDGFRSVCILVKGTNEPFQDDEPQEMVLTAMDKGFVNEPTGKAFVELSQNRIKEWLSRG